MARAGILAAAASLMLAACAVPPAKDGLTYSPPKTAPAEGAITMSGNSQAEAVNAAATQLRAAGLRVVKADRRGGTVIARSSGAALVDCGTFTQTARGNTVQFPASAPRAVLFDVTRPGELVLREVAASSEVKLAVGAAPPYAVTAMASHDVRVSQKAVSSATKDWRAHRRFDSGQSAVFPDGVTCVDNGRVAQILSDR